MGVLEDSQQPIKFFFFNISNFFFQSLSSKKKGLKFLKFWKNAE